MKYQFIENENFIKNADFENCKVYLMNKTNSEIELPSDLIVNEVSESFAPDSNKFPLMLTFANNDFLENGSETDTFEYEIITDNSDNYSFKAFVCDIQNITVIE